MRCNLLATRRVRRRHPVHLTRTARDNTVVAALHMVSMRAWLMQPSVGDKYPIDVYISALGSLSESVGNDSKAQSCSPTQALQAILPMTLDSRRRHRYPAPAVLCVRCSFCCDLPRAFRTLKLTMCYVSKLAHLLLGGRRHIHRVPCGIRCCACRFGKLQVTVDGMDVSPNSDRNLPGTQLSATNARRLARCVTIEIRCAAVKHCCFDHEQGSCLYTYGVFPAGVQPAPAALSVHIASGKDLAQQQDSVGVGNTLHTLAASGQLLQSDQQSTLWTIVTHLLPHTGSSLKLLHGRIAGHKQIANAE